MIRPLKISNLAKMSKESEVAWHFRKPPQNFCVPPFDAILDSTRRWSAGDHIAVQSELNGGYIGMLRIVRVKAPGDFEVEQVPD